MPAFRSCCLVPGRSRWALLLALLGAWLLLAPLARAQAPAFGFAEPGQRRMQMKFLLERNLIIVPVRLNGQGPYYFMLDTGVGSSLITDPALRDSLGLRLGQTFYVSGAGEEAPLVAYQVDSVQVEIGDKWGTAVAPRLSMLLLSTDAFDLSGYVGMPMAGILGSDVFNSFAVEVDAEARELVLHRPDRFRPPKGRRWERIPLLMEGNRAYLDAPVAVNDSVNLDLRLILDTGAGHALSLETGSDARITLPPRRLRTHLGRGLSGDVRGYLGRTNGIRLGRYRLKSLITSFPDENAVHARTNSGIERKGNLGFEMLKRFNVIIDYSRNTLFLKPNALFRDPFEHDMCGIGLVASGADYHRYFIDRIEPASPADAACLQVDDELVAINFRTVSTMTLTELSRLLHSADGRVLIMLVRRPDGELVVTNLKLHRQI